MRNLQDTLKDVSDHLLIPYIPTFKDFPGAVGSTHIKDCYQVYLI